MWALIAFLLQVVTIAAGIRREPEARSWTWSRFLFTIAFALLELALFIAPVRYMNSQTRHFLPVYAALCGVAALNVVWFIVVARRWRPLDGHSSPPTWRNEQKR
jgi:hypothetical protein